MWQNISDSSVAVGTMPCDLIMAKFKHGRGNSNKQAMCSYFMVADIETSHNYVPNSNKDFKAWSYQQAQALFNSETGECLEYNESRNITEFVSNFFIFNENLRRKNARGIVFFHNLKFDIRFFRLLLIAYFNAAYPDKPIDKPVDQGGLFEDFMTDNNTWLYFRICNLEFRCSWRLTNQSLYGFTKDMHVKHKKLLQANDYGIHYPDEYLSQQYHDYMFNDVVGLGEAICQLLKLEKLTLETLPYTSTGFPRNDVKKAFRNDKKEIKEFIKTRPVPQEFRCWAKAYSGGLTQVNELYEGKLVEANEEFSIKHRDFVSFYPSLICTQKFPIGDRDVLDISDDYKVAETQLKNLVYSDDRLVFAQVLIVNYGIKENVIPFIPERHVETVTEKVAPIYYSHKLKYFHGSFIINTCTPELKMIYEESNTTAVIPLTVYHYKAVRMSKPILDVTMKYFIDKTVYKNKVKHAEENQSADLLELQSLLQRSKAKLNGIYGMLCEMLIKDNFTIDSEGNVNVEHVNIYDLENIEKMLASYYGTSDEPGSCKNGKCFSYALGVYVTAWAKYYLFKYCKTIGWENVLYVDTDSAFYKSNEEIEQRIEKLNNELRAEAIAANAYIDIDGKRTYLHYFDDEEEDIKMFKALNAKRYMYYGFNKKGKQVFKLTCAGVTGGIGLHEDTNGNAVYDVTREMEICDYTTNTELKLDDIKRGFDNFENGVGRKFKLCGGTTARYINYSIEELILDDHYIVSEGGIAIVGTEKELNAIGNKKLNEFGEAIYDFSFLDSSENDCEIAKEFSLKKQEVKL